MTQTAPQAQALKNDVHGQLKPRLRGLIHAYSIAPMAVAGVFLVALAPTARSRFSIAVYALAIMSMLTASAMYHRARVSEETRLILRKLDHSMIGVAVAGTYTPVIVITLSGWAMALMLAFLWTGALATTFMSMMWHHAPNWVRGLAYGLLGISGVAIMPYVLSRGGVAVFALVIIGGVFYIAGAVAYALRKPNFWPSWFGFHEVFHTFVMLAVLSHFAAVLVLAVRAG